MKYKIEPLEKDKWQDYDLIFEYSTNCYFDFETTAKGDEITVKMVKRAFEKTIQKSFTDKVFPCYFENQEGYGVVKDDELLAVIALSKEDWNNRLRITNLLVSSELRRQGIGARLMDIAKARAKELGCRSIILETQSCNEKAINFYFSQGFSLFGFDTNCYSNNDIAKKEVRLELGLIIDV